MAPHTGRRLIWITSCLVSFEVWRFQFLFMWSLQKKTYILYKLSPRFEPTTCLIHGLIHDELDRSTTAVDNFQAEFVKGKNFSWKNGRNVVFCSGLVDSFPAWWVGYYSLLGGPLADFMCVILISSEKLNQLLSTFTSQKSSMGELGKIFCEPGKYG